MHKTYIKEHNILICIQIIILLIQNAANASVILHQLLNLHDYHITHVSCDKRRTKNKGSRKCERDKIKYRNKQCGGVSEIYEHNKIKSTCKTCGGRSICEHDKRKSTCKLCGCGSTCEHNKIKSTCKLKLKVMWQWLHM